MLERDLLAISPVDGRYTSKTEPLQAIFSEYALIRYRFQIEIDWFKHLAKQSAIEALPPLSNEDDLWLTDCAKQFSLDDALAVKKLEATTNHDVKAVEYFLKERMAERASLKPLLEFVHFACTSEDINNLAYALMLKDARTQVLLPAIKKITTKLGDMAEKYADAAMLARTHGQPASPTTMGKEIANVLARLRRQIDQFKAVTITGKINGAVGNYNAHMVAYPNLDWPKICADFVARLGITFNAYTTQIEPHDYIAEYCQALSRLNSILIDYDKDVWGYISLGYFIQLRPEKEVGSSTMPHKVNPIDFENSEGNLYLARALLGFFANQLPISRWQRDLTDSTLLRNLGVAVAHTLIGWQATLQGIDKLVLAESALAEDLAQNWEVLAEPIQTLMRKHGIANPYEKLKSATKGRALNQAQMQALITELDLPASALQALENLTPASYTGLAPQLANAIRQQGGETIKKL